MRKILLILMLVLASSIAFVSCEKEEENPMINTKWSAAYGENVLWIEFTSETNFQNYMTDLQGNISITGAHYGTYSYSDNYVIFETHSTNTFNNASINGNILTLTYKSGYIRTFIKK